ncbi:MAG TPA: M20/M25/M40 family metallo-hydrolase [Cytophagaceae bacterium]|jgi:putative aminopeptidase FrvX
MPSLLISTAWDLVKVKPTKYSTVTSKLRLTVSKKGLNNISFSSIITFMNTSSKEFLFRYINNASPSGSEESGQKIWLDYIRPYVDDHFIDIYGSVAAIINPDKKFKVVIEAHSDQVSFRITYIDKNGYIYVTKNGGADPVIAPSKSVNIFTQKGIVKGVFGWAATHVRQSNQNTPTIENIFIETGLSSKKEVLESGIDIGCVVTFADELQMLNDIIVGPGLDNKVGGFMIAEVARLLKKHKEELPFALYIINSVQEETGKNGAVLMGNNIRPDIAIVTDVTHDTQAPMYNKKLFGDISCGKGPVFSLAASVHTKLVHLLMDTARENNIPFQRKAGSKGTGTDSDAFAYSDSGVAAALVALPLKYMHTTVECVHQNDVNNAIQLLLATLKKITPEIDLKYFH